MTYDEIAVIAKRLDKDKKRQIDLDVEERMEILKQGNLTKKELEQMEENLYMSLVLQEYLSGEYELLEEEKALLLAEMEDMYNIYVDLLSRAKLEKKLSKKKMMTLELMKIREQLLKHKKTIARVKADMKTTKKNIKDLEEKSSKKKMKDVALGLDMSLDQGKENNQKIDVLSRRHAYDDLEARRMMRDEARNVFNEERKRENVATPNKRSDGNSVTSYISESINTRDPVGGPRIESGAAAERYNRGRSSDFVPNINRRS